MDERLNEARGSIVGGLTGARSASTQQTPLDAIVGRIERATMSALEIGNKLNEHADRVHGPATVNRVDTAKRLQDADRPGPALERVFAALAELDEAQNYIAEAAGRNTTLA